LFFTSKPDKSVKAQIDEFVRFTDRPEIFDSSPLLEGETKPNNKERMLRVSLPRHSPSSISNSVRTQKFQRSTKQFSFGGKLQLHR